MTINGAVYGGTTNSENGTSKTEAELKEQSTYASPVNGDGLGGLGWQFCNGTTVSCDAATLGRCQLPDIRYYAGRNND